MRKSITGMIAGTAALAVVLTGCSSKATDTGGSGSTDGVATDFGVTDSTITLGVQSDLSGVFKSIGLALTHGNELWVADANAAGGICGRQIALDIVDNAYNVDKALPLYEQQKDKILGYMQLIGSAITAALKTKVAADGMLAVPAAPASAHLDSENIMLLGITYDVEMINVLSYMMDEGMIKSGDKVGYIYLDNEYGQNGLLGAKYFASENNIQLIESPVSASDSDMTATITKYKSDGVTAIALTTTPTATASVVTQNAGQGLNVPVGSSNPSFTPNMMADANVAALVQQFLYIGQGYAAFDGEPEIAKKVAAEYDKKYSADQPNYAVNAGYIQGMAWGALLEEACDKGDLTRAGTLAARETAPKVDSEGLSGTLNLKYDGAPSSRESFIMRPDPSLINRGGVTVLTGPFVSETAESYKTPYQK